MPSLRHYRWEIVLAPRAPAKPEPIRGQVRGAAVLSNVCWRTFLAEDLGPVAGLRLTAVVLTLFGHTSQSKASVGFLLWPLLEGTRFKQTQTTAKRVASNALLYCNQ